MYGILMADIKSLDLSLGMRGEENCKPLLEIHFGNKINYTKPYHPYDYFFEKSFIELKTRRVRHDCYKTTIIPLSKVKRMKKGYNYYFAFSFLDGLYIFKYDEDLVRLGRGGRCDRGCEEWGDYIHIDYRDLTCIVEYD